MAVKGQTKLLIVPIGVPQVADPMLNESKAELRGVDDKHVYESEDDGSTHAAQIVQELLKQEMHVELVLNGAAAMDFAPQAKPKTRRIPDIVFRSIETPRS